MWQILSVKQNGKEEGEGLDPTEKPKGGKK